MSSLALPAIDIGLCSRCGLCVWTCPGHAVELTPAGPVFVRPSGCNYCAECEAICPAHAIRCEFSIIDASSEG